MTRWKGLAGAATHSPKPFMPMSRVRTGAHQSTCTLLRPGREIPPASQRCKPWPSVLPAPGLPAKYLRRQHPPAPTSCPARQPLLPGLQAPLQGLGITCLGLHTPALAPHRGSLPRVTVYSVSITSMVELLDKDCLNIQYFDEGCNHAGSSDSVAQGEPFHRLAQHGVRFAIRAEVPSHRPK